MESFELRFTVTPADIDEQGHVNNIVYLRWVQELAVGHWRAAAPAPERDTLRWVVTRHEIDYKRAALPGDEVAGHTWVGTATRLTFERHTTLTRASDGKLLAKARTLWCPVDPVTGKPVDVSPEVRKHFSVITQEHP
jgi:acyl-CoA thioester hydrolase